MRCTGWMVVVAAIAWSSAAYADDTGWYDGELVFKNSSELKEYKTEAEACTGSAAALTKMGNKQQYVSFKKGTDEWSVTCVLKDLLAKGQPQWDQVNNVTKVIKCKDNTNAVSTDNSGRFGTVKCRCDPTKGCPDSAPIHPPVVYGCKTPPDNPVCTGKSFPPLDTSDRCTQQPAHATSKKSAERQSEANKKAVQQHDPQLKKDYDAALRDIRKDIKDAKVVGSSTKTGVSDPAGVKAFPVFTKDQMCETGGPTDVNIGTLCGTREADFAAANNIAGLGATPTYDGNDGRESIPGLDCVWHHHEQLGRMQLVKKSAHGSEQHTGGVKVWQQALGVPDYPLCCPPKK